MMDDDRRQPNEKYDRPWTEMGAPRAPDIRDIYRWIRDGMSQEPEVDEAPAQDPPMKDLREQE